MLNLNWLLYSGWGRVSCYVAIGVGLMAVNLLS